ncbi:MAG: hypothetical protein AAGA58_11575, partial [Verrucomicrobiota bacterium]
IHGYPDILSPEISLRGETSTDGIHWDTLNYLMAPVRKMIPMNPGPGEIQYWEQGKLLIPLPDQSSAMGRLRVEQQ